MTHPREIAVPRTAAASQARRVHSTNRGSRRSRFISDETGEGEARSSSQKPVKLQRSEVGQLVMEKGIKTFEELIHEGDGEFCILITHV